MKKMVEGVQNPMSRMKLGTIDQVVHFVEWMADKPCRSGYSCRLKSNAIDNLEWCCETCRAAVLRYGPPEEIEFK